MKIKLKLILILLLGVLFITGCKKEGPPGADGNANVDYSTQTVTSWGWSSPYYYANLPMPELTSANINTAAVMVYFTSTGSAWVALPYTQYNSPNQNYIMGFNTSVGQVQITWFYDTSLFDGDDPNTYYGTNLQFKIVVIPPAVMLANPDLDLRDYEDVKNRFKIKD